MLLRINKYKDEVWYHAADFDFLEYQDHIDTMNLKKVCPWCGDLMLYNEYLPEENKNSPWKNPWIVSYRVPLNQGGKRTIDNLQAIHAKCENEKNSDYTVLFGTDS